MTPAEIRALCLALPGATESIQWGNDRVFKVGGKMFAVIGAQPDAAAVSFKAAADSYPLLITLAGVRPAPYLARAHWVLVEPLGALPAEELAAYLRRAHALIVAGLPKKIQAALAAQADQPPAARPRPAADIRSRNRTESRTSRGRRAWPGR